MPEIVNDADIRLDEDQYEKLGKLFKAWIDQVEDNRRRRMEKVWVRALRNYEGHAPIKQFPWFGASNAVLNDTQVHTDALEARLYSAGTSQGDPLYLIVPNSNEPIIPGLPDPLTGLLGDPLVTPERFAEWWQNVSEWVETTQIPHGAVMEEVTWTYCLYGDAWVYPHWEKEEVMDVVRNPKSGALEKVPRVLWDKTVLTVLHPKDVYLAPWDHDAQTARTIGFSFMLDGHDLDMRKKRKVYKKSRVEELEKILEKRKTEEKSIVGALEARGYYKEWDGGYYPKDEFEKKLEQEQFIEEATPYALKMVKVFQRVDLDGDGVPEEVQFEVEKTSGVIAVARYKNLLHNQRPLIHFYYNRRVGAAYNRGVPEILFNGQEIVNTLMRDMLDNNKIKNTKLFIGRVGSGLQKNTKIYPSRLLLLPNPKEDFQVVDLGGSGIVSGVNELATVRSSNERATGISDINLGVEKKSRTPASTTMALLEEGAKRTDRVIDRQGDAQAQMWWQVLCLYRQNADPRKLAIIAGVEEGDVDLFLQAWTKVGVQEMSEYISIQPQVSSSSFNRSIQKQELMTVMGQVEHWYEQINVLMSLYAGAQIDPAAQKIFISMAEGGHRLMSKFLSLFDVKEQEKLNPDELVEWMKAVMSVPAGGAVGGGDEGGNPNDAAIAESAGAAQPGEGGPAQGRPQAGVPRSDGPTPGIAG